MVESEPASEDKLKTQGKLFVICGPSGVGKKTLISRILKKNYLNLDLSISFTTREKRPEEKEGVDYFFIDKKAFLKNLEEKKVIEYASFFNNFYGTPKAFLEERLSIGRNVLLEVEVLGFRQIVSKYPDAVTIFIRPPRIADLYLRLLKRNTEDSERIYQRIEKAKKELKEVYSFKYTITNKIIEEAAEELENLIFSEID